MEHIVYILFSKKIGKFYIGYTSNFDGRLDFHLNDEQSRKFTFNAADRLLLLKQNVHPKCNYFQVRNISKP
jgi:putative endonuclease